MIRLAFTGSHSSGKSTLIKAFVETKQDSSILVIEGLTRAIISRGFPLAKDSTVDSYANYIRDQLRATREFSNMAPDILVMDRTVLDAASYARVNTTLPRPYIPEYFVEMLLEVAILEASRIDLFVFCPVEFPMEKDDVRPLDEEYRRKVGNQIREFLTEYNIPFVEVTGNVSERLFKLNIALEKIYG